MPIPKLVVALATTALQVGLQASRHTYGPRPDELNVTTADYGTPRLSFLGTRKIAPPIIWGKKLEVVEKTQKVKGGGKQTTYGTLATFAVEVADCRYTGPIQKILKIWMDEKLVYDVTGTGPTSLAAAAGLNLASVMRIYLGTEDQMPDPAYVDYCEEKFGPNSAVAFRGKAVIFFDRLPCDNFGNRVPTIKVLAASEAAAHFPFDTVYSPTTNSSANFVSSPSGQWTAMVASAGQNWWFDTPSATYTGAGGSPGFFTGSVSAPSMAEDGSVYFVGDRLNDPHLGNNYFFCEVSPIGTPILTEANPSTLAFGSTRALETASGLQVLTNYATAAGYLDFATHVDHAQSLRDSCVDEDGNLLKLFHPTGASDEFTIEGPDGSHTFTGTSRSGPTTAYICKVASTGKVLVVTDGNFYLIDATAWTISSSGAASWGAALPKNNAEQKPNLTSVWNFGSGFEEYSLEDGSLLRTVPTSSWTSAVSNAHWIYDRASDAIWTRSSTSGQPIKILYLNRALGSAVTLGDVISVMCDEADLAERDTSLLTQPVDGYSWTRSVVKSRMEPLLDIHDVDACPHDFTVKFQPRGSAPGATILASDLVVTGGKERYEVKIAQDTDVPKIIRVNFADKDHDQQPNNVLSPLPADAIDSKRDQVIDLTTWVDTADGAQEKADRFMRRQINSREGIDAAITGQLLAIEPGDVVPVTLGDGLVHNAKLDRQTFVGTRIDCSFVRDETGLAELNGASGPPMDSRDPQTIVIPAPVRGFVIDAPLRSDDDADTRPLLYAGAGSYGQLTFPGAVTFEATGPVGDRSYDELVDSFSSGLTWGTCSSTLADVPSPWMWDRGNTLTVTLQSGSLTNASEDDLDADPSLNLLLVGATGRWEYVQFATATLNADGSYTLSGFKRGRRGSEWACGLHHAGEAWVLASALTPEEMGADDVGAALSFKTQSVGRSLDAAPANDVDPFTAATLKPRAPASIAWTYDGTDLIGTITRRTRVGGAWVGGSTIPLSEASEAYDVEILDGSGNVLRTIAVTGTNVFTYTAAMAAADGVTLPTPPSVNIYQLSNAVGRGYALAA